MTTNRDLWNVKSIYDFQYFNCPSCSSKKYASKQDFVNHIWFNHPESIEYLKEISDGSLSNILQPWGDENAAKNVKYKVEEESDNIEIDYFNNDVEQEDDLMDIKDDNLATNVTINIPEENFNKCDSCGKTFTKSGDLKKQIKTIHEKQTSNVQEFDDSKDFIENQNNENEHLLDLPEAYDCVVYLTRLQQDENLLADPQENKHECKICGKSYVSVAGLEYHISVVHSQNDNDHKCDTCGESFTRSMFLKKHMNKVHGTHFDNKCIFCEKLFEDSKNLYDHIYKYHKEKMKKDVKCESCEKTFYTKKQLKIHSYNAHGQNKEKPKCEICGKNFLDARNLQRHKNNVHEGRRDYKCEVCGRFFATNDYLNTHIALHKNREELKCTSCELVFLKVSELEKHKFTVHEGHKNGKCGICHRQFDPKYFHTLKKHVREVHENADRKDHLCTLCGKSYKRSESLSTHILSVHEGKNEFKCEFCFKEFPEKHKLKMHKRLVHDKIKDFICDSCGKAFWTKSQLKMHVKVKHEFLKEYKCKECGKLFGISGTLASHIKMVHENVKNHKCEICGKDFFARSDMRRHIDSVHLKKPDVWNRKGKKKKINDIM